jgi:hypothetical protein
MALHPGYIPVATRKTIPAFISNRKPFKTANKSVFALRFFPVQAHETTLPDFRPTHQRYVVFSYGEHFPMYVYDYQFGKWYGNADKYSKTTSCHQGLCHPGQVESWHDTHNMHLIARYGVVGALSLRCAGLPAPEFFSPDAR